MKHVFMFLVLASTALAQPRLLNTYTTTCTLSLSSAAGACTVQQPASGARTVQFVAAYIYSTAAVNITLERDGTAATATAGTVLKANSGADTPTATAWTSSNVGVGSLIVAADSLKVAANSREVLDLEDIQMRGSGTAKNFTVRTSSVTATVTIIIKWREY